jgi:hypothetical protein
MSWVSWLFEHAGLLVFVVVAISFVQKVRAFWKRAQSETEEHSRDRRPIASHDPDEVRRVEEIQDEIRRKIAERRGGAALSGDATAESRSAPPPVPRRAPPGDPFAGPTRRIFEELERRLQPPAPEPPDLRKAQAAEVARQEQLAEQMRALESARFAAEQRARETSAALRREAQSQEKRLTAARNTLLADLKDPAGLRRAMILREVLGTPVGLR